MNFTKNQIKIILLIIAATIFMLWIALNHQAALDVISYIIGLLMPLIFGLCMAFILNVLMKFFENKLLGRLTNRIDSDSKGGKVWTKLLRPISMLLTLIAVAGIITFVISMIIPSLKDTISLIIQKTPHVANIVKAWLENVMEHFGLDMSMDSVKQIRDIINSYNADAVDNIVQFITGTGSAFAVGVAGFAESVFSTLANAVLGFIFAVYILLTKETLGRQTKNVILAAFSEKRSTQILDIARLSQHIFEKFVAGQCIDAVILGTLSGLGSFFINSQFAVMLGVLIGFTALIPVVGPLLGVVVGALLLITVSPWQALAFIILIIALQQFDNNVTYPKIVGKSIGLPGMWVLFAVLVGGSIYGIFGIIIGVPLASVLYSLGRVWTQKRLKEKNLLVDDDMENDDKNPDYSADYINDEEALEDAEISIDEKTPDPDESSTSK